MNDQVIDQLNSFNNKIDRIISKQKKIKLKNLEYEKMKKYSLEYHDVVAKDEKYFRKKGEVGNS